MSADLDKRKFLVELESIVEDDEAYGSNISVLNYTIKDGVIAGKFRDSWNNRIYEFEIDSNSISYKPAINLDSANLDSESARQFDLYSNGYNSLFAGRQDGKLTGKRVKKPKCGSTAYGCGFSCIGLKKTCRILGRTGRKAGTNQGSAIGKERLIKLIDLSTKLAVAGDKKGFAEINAVGSKVSKAREKRTAAGSERLKERQVNRELKGIEETTQKARETRLNATKNQKEKLPIDRTLFDVKFPSGISGSVGSLIDRAEIAQDMAKGKNPYFTEATPAEKGQILRDMVSEYDLGNVNLDLALKEAIKSDDKNNELYARAAITRLQAARALWADLPEKEKRIVARKLNYEERGRGGLTAENRIKNQYIEELRKEFTKYIVPNKNQKTPDQESTSPTTKAKSPTVDTKIFKTQFPSKEVQREYGLGGVVDRAKEVINLMEKPKEFSKFSPKEQAGILDNFTTIHGVSDKDWGEQLKNPAVANNPGRKMGAEAANIRAQGSKQIWDNLNADEKIKLAKSLKEIGSALANEDDKFENKYVARLADEIRSLNTK